MYGFYTYVCVDLKEDHELGMETYIKEMIRKNECIYEIVFKTLRPDDTPILLIKEITK
jgi:hypothetical protein